MKRTMNSQVEECRGVVLRDEWSTQRGTAARHGSPTPHIPGGAAPGSIPLLRQNPGPDTRKMKFLQ